ncbi:MAG TPA: hypothetical protein VET86_11460 [Casimicrobiaceae bacterium]|nr:hypothetical protein [Casimicrobiaceae bacterium]
MATAQSRKPRRPAKSPRPEKRAQRKKSALRSPRRKHEVKGELANFELAKAKSSLNLEIFANNEKIGELEIGRGSLFWYGRNRHKSKRLNWSRFAEMMDVLAYGEHLSGADK